MRMHGTLLMAALIICPTARSSVVTERLEWRVADLNAGLIRLKEQVLDRSLAEDVEFVGAVLRRDDGQFAFTQGRGLPGQDQVTFRIRRPEDAEIVGLWHTHGAHGPARAVFSPTDAELVRQTGLPFYLITPEGEVRVLRPEHVAGAKRSAWSARGSVARLPRGSHPGERISGRAVRGHPVRGCADVMEV